LFHTITYKGLAQKNSAQKISVQKFC